MGYSQHTSMPHRKRKKEKRSLSCPSEMQVIKVFLSVCLNCNTYSSLLITVIQTSIQRYRTIHADPESFPFLGTKDVNNSLKRISYVKINISKELVQHNLLLLVQSNSVTLNLSLQISFSCANVSKSLMAY